MADQSEIDTYQSPLASAYARGFRDCRRKILFENMPIDGALPGVEVPEDLGGPLYVELFRRLRTYSVLLRGMAWRASYFRRTKENWKASAHRARRERDAAREALQQARAELHNLRRETAVESERDAGDELRDQVR